MTAPRPHLFRRDKLTCESCGRDVVRHARQQRFCSARCKEKGRTRVRKAALTTDTGAPSHRIKKDRKLKALQHAKTLSSHRIFGPATVLVVEVFARNWQPAVSADGVPIETSRIRPRALVGAP